MSCWNSSVEVGFQRTTESRHHEQAYGSSTGDVRELLAALVGPEAKGLSAPVVARLKRCWSQEYQTWRRRSLGKERWVYLWADGIYSGLRADGERLCALVVIGVNERGQKRFLAIEDGMRESKTSWAICCAI